MADADIAQTKSCTKCGKTAPLTYFSPQPNSTRRDRRHSHCRDCAKETTRRYRDRGRAEIIKQAPWKHWKYVSREMYLRSFESRRSFMRKYGITLDGYLEMVEAQRGKCAICQSKPTGKRNLAIDHCHSSGMVRGLLCDNCNRGIGYLGESPSRMISAIEYVRARTPDLLAAV